ncbi:hypothetical protein [Streptomyces sp. NPDC053048]|uniref:hypothetical protein n=1 Tax=Streptomyces sp. NPDC053048 TaxID=3365694 RepID=UPI0037D465D1
MSIVECSSPFDAFERHVTQALHTEGADEPHFTGVFGPRSLTIPEARSLLYDRSQDDRACDEIWRHVIIAAQHDEPPGREFWHLSALWLAIPALRSRGYRIAYRLRADRRDIEGEMTLAFIEALLAADPALDRPGRYLLRTASGRAWEAARRHLPETCTGTIEATAPVHQIFEVPGPQRYGHVSASWRVVMTRNSVEGERLGALARNLGLDAAVSAEHPRRHGTRTGTIRLRRAAVRSSGEAK